MASCLDFDVELRLRKIIIITGFTQIRAQASYAVLCDVRRERPCVPIFPLEISQSDVLKMNKLALRKSIAQKRLTKVSDAGTISRRVCWYRPGRIQRFKQIVFPGLRSSPRTEKKKKGKLHGLVRKNLSLQMISPD